ncbi:MAG: NADH-quinone oxidoreductase subunit I [Firmicutes bacterium]|nr:NADH-quinone oxidoreductase subunit I [Bacillota bacterium]
MGYLADKTVDVIRSTKSIGEGLGITFRNLFRPPITVQYPDERVKISSCFRGMPALLTNRETGELNCTACGICARACPLGIITMELGKDGKKRFPTSFSIDMSRCMVCNLCVEACPFEALGMSNRYELAETQHGSLVWDLDRLSRLGREHPASQVGQPARKGGEE